MILPPRPSRFNIVIASMVALLCIGAASKENGKDGVRAVIVIPAPTSRPIVPQPDAEAQAKALKLVKEAFGDAYLAKTPAERRSLARRLLQQGVETNDNPAARFVLIRDARDFAALAGDASTCVNAVGQLERFYDVQPLPMLVTAITIAQRNAESPEANAAAAHAALGGVERAVAVEEFSFAPQFLAIARAGAARSQRVALVAQVQNRERELNALFAEHHRVDSARQTIRMNPDDSQACTIMGRYLCFSKGDWEGGLPFLMRCGEPSLRELAAADLAAARDASLRRKAADGWWEMARTRTGLMRKHLRDRAALHYRQMLSATGISRTLAERRLGEAEIEAMRDLNFSPGLLAELYRGIDFTGVPLKARIDAQVNFNWEEEAADQSLPKDNFAIRWSGILRPPSPGRYELIVVANMGVRIRIGGQMVCDEPDLSRKRTGTRIDVDIPQGLHVISVEFWDKTGKAQVQLKWRRPGAINEELIPASAFFHDRGLDHLAAEPR